MDAIEILPAVVRGFRVQHHAFCIQVNAVASLTVDFAFCIQNPNLTGASARGVPMRGTIHG
jgi:hypothetical protein